MFRVALDFCCTLGLNGNHFLIQPELLLTPIQKVCAKLALSLQSFEHRTINLIQGESICIITGVSLYSAVDLIEILVLLLS